MKFAILPILMMLSSTTFAGPITAGGHILFEYRAVCFVQLDPQQLPQYEITVGFKDDNNLNKVTIYKNPSDNPVVIAEGQLTQVFMLNLGTHETYIGVNGSDLRLNIDLDVKGPQKRAGFSGTIEGQKINTTVSCQVFPNQPGAPAGQL